MTQMTSVALNAYRPMNAELMLHLAFERPAYMIMRPGTDWRHTNVPVVWVAGQHLILGT